MGEYTEYMNNAGAVSGTSREYDDFLGNGHYTEYTGRTGKTVGTSREYDDFLGNGHYTEYRDSSGEITGTSREYENFWGNGRYIEYRNKAGEVTGRSRVYEDFRSGGRKEEKAPETHSETVASGGGGGLLPELPDAVYVVFLVMLVGFLRFLTSMLRSLGQIIETNSGITAAVLVAGLPLLTCFIMWLYMRKKKDVNVRILASAFVSSALVYFLFLQGDLYSRLINTDGLLSLGGFAAFAVAFLVPIAIFFLSYAPMLITCVVAKKEKSFNREALYKFVAVPTCIFSFVYTFATTANTDNSLWDSFAQCIGIMALYLLPALFIVSRIRKRIESRN